MRFPLMTTLTTFLVMTVTTGPVNGKAMPLTPVPVRVAQSDCVVVGKIVRFEQNPVKASTYPGGKKIDHRVAVVKIEKGILSPMGLTHIRVGYPPMSRTYLGGYGLGAMVKDHEVCLFLHSHHDEAFYSPRMYMDVVSSKSPVYAKEVKEAEKAGALMRDPLKSLKSKDAQDRVLTAVLLVNRYRQRPSGMMKEEPVSAVESKLILETLANANWNAPALSYYLRPLGAFQRLGLSAKDGWTPPKNYREIPVVAKQWLKKNASTYRIKQWVLKK